MPSWPSARNLRLCSGCLLRRALVAFVLTSTVTIAQTTHQPVSKKATTHRANEFTLAGLRPGKDSYSRAVKLYGKPERIDQQADESTWEDICRWRTLIVEKDSTGRIQTLRLTQHSQRIVADCTYKSPDPWRTGQGLLLRDTADRLLQLYGAPDSKSPSTRDGQPLELWYYAFDWAGPDVPQVMEVLCTREKEGQPGRVIEITLAAPSL